MKSILLILVFFLNFSLLAKTFETKTFADIEQKTKEMVKKYGANNVLVVLDIDNTVLTMTQNLGSDQWFNWQYTNCVKKSEKADFCAANNMGELLDLQARLFAISPMKPTEKITPKVVRTIQDLGVKTMLLTSRGPNNRDATQRELKKNGYDLTLNTIGPKGGFPSVYIPYDVKKPNEYGLDQKDIKTAGLGKARKVSFMNGVMMTSGLNKGIMLKTILAKTNSKFKAIIFADDHEKHTKRVEAIFAPNKTVELYTYRYGAIDSIVKSFNAGDKSKVKQSFTAYKDALNKIFK